MDNLEPERISERTAVTVYNVSGCVKSWGLRGIMAGSLIGFALGVAFVALPHTDSVLTFGVAGTLIVAMVEGAVFAGAFAAFAAALYGKGALRGRAAKSSQTPPTCRRIPEPGWREGDIPLSDWPASRPHPGSAVAQPLPEIPEDTNTVPPSLQSVQTWLKTLDVWETGRTDL
jgi:hypothetical protein